MDGLAVFLIVAITIALVFIIATSVVFMIAFYKLYGYIKLFLGTKDWLKSHDRLAVLGLSVFL